MTGQIKGDALKNTLNGDSASSPLFSPTPLIYAHFTSNLPPSFIHANPSLSRRIYIHAAAGQRVTRFIYAEFIGSSLLSCFGSCVVSETQRVKCEPWGHLFSSQSKPGKVEPRTFVTNTESECFGGSVRAPAHVLMHVCTSVHECQVSLCCRCWISQRLFISADPGSHHCSQAVNHPAAIRALI